MQFTTCTTCKPLLDDPYGSYDLYDSYHLQYTPSLTNDMQFTTCMTRKPLFHDPYKSYHLEYTTCIKSCTGKKANPGDVTKEMQDAKDSLILLEEWTPACQNTVFFSRFSALQKRKGAHPVGGGGGGSRRRRRRILMMMISAAGKVVLRNRT